MYLANIYAPHDYTMKPEFFDELSKLSFHPDTIFLGDFNIVGNHFFDHFPPLPRTAQDSHYLTDFKFNRELVDPVLDYLSLDPTERVSSNLNISHISTFSRINKSSESETRIDIILVPESLKSYFIPLDSQSISISDHRLVSMEFSPPMVSTQVSWKKIFPHVAKSQSIANWTSKFFNYPRNLSSDQAATTWVTLKSRLIKFNSHSGSRKVRKISAQLKSLLNEQAHLKANSSYPPSTQWISRWQEIEYKILQIHKENDRITLLQANARWTALGERPNKAFYKSVNTRKLATSITSLNTSHGNSSEPALVNQEIFSFYDSLYRSSNSCPDNYSLERPLKLNSVDIKYLTERICPAEVISTVRTLPNNKSPGPDGIPYEYYKQNLKQLMKILIPMFNGILSSSMVIPDAGNVITVLLYKKGDRSNLKNWRPIALSNTDCKIYSKILAKRIGKIMQSYISPQQFGFVPNRSIWDNIFQVNNVTVSTGVKGALAFLDQEKAYDRVSWSYLRRILKDMDFPNPIITWILNSLSSSSIKIIGLDTFTDPISPSRGLRQGDPLSPILYNIAFDPFIRTINTHIKGISIHSQDPLRILAFADDCVVGLKDRHDTKMLEKIVTEYESISQAKLNKLKTQIILLGKQRFILPFKSRPTSQPVTHLGIPFTKTGPTTSLIEASLLSKVSSSIMSFKAHNVTIIGRVTLINTFIVSKLYYYSRICSFSPSFIRQLSALINKFVWNSTQPSRPLSSLFGSISLGGLGLIDFPTKCSLIFGKWLYHVLFPSPDWIWSKSACFAFSKALKLLNPANKYTLLNYFASHPNPNGPHQLADFWRTVLLEIRRNKWIVQYSFRNTNHGVKKEFSLTFRSLPLSSPIPHILEDYSRFRITTIAHELPHDIQIANPDKIYKLAHSQLVPPKYRANYWKFVTRSYKLADREPFRNFLCLHCNQTDSHLHRFVLCKTAQLIWSTVLHHFLEFEKTIDASTIMEIILGNFDKFPKFRSELITVLVHNAMWTIHCMFVNQYSLVSNNTYTSAPTIQPISSQQIVNTLIENITKCFYTIFISYALPRHSLSRMLNSNPFKTVTIDKTNGTVRITPPNPNS